jgi:tetratricopeptide (TPR) repeat protein
MPGRPLPAPIFSERENMPPVTQDDIHLAFYYASRLKEFGEAFTKGQNDEAFRNFRKDWLQIKLSFDRVSSILKQPGAARICVDFVNNKGLWLLDIHRPVSERLSWFELARRAALQIGDDQSLVIILHNLGIATLNLGKPTDAIKLHKEELAIARRIKHAVGIAQATSSVGTCYRHLGQYRQALRWHKKVLLLEDTDEIAHLRLNAIGNIGITLLLLRRPETACEYFETVLEMTRRLDRRREEAYAIGYLGQALQDMGRPKEALEKHKQALAISSGISDTFGEAGALGGLGNALLDLQQIPQALTYHRDQLRLAEMTAQPAAVAGALINLGISLLYNREEVEASALRDQSVEIYKRIKNQAALVALKERWSIACERLGKLDEAISFCESAIEISIQHKLPSIGILKRRTERLQRQKLRSD